jgi:hypothetical protein
MELPRFIFISLSIISIAQISHAENVPTSVANSFVRDFPYVVLANCDLVRLTCGNEKLVVTEHTRTWGGQEETSTIFQGQGIEIRTSDGVDLIDIRNRGISIPDGLNVGEARSKVQDKLGKPSPIWAGESQDCMEYEDSEKASELRFCFESEQIVQVLWSQYRAP